MCHLEIKTIGKMLVLQVLLLCCVAVKADDSSVTLSIGEPSVPPVVGGTFETTIDYSSDYIILGAYHVKLHYNPNVIRILQISIPADSNFFDNTFVDTNSFSSGETGICAFQVENLLNQVVPETIAVVEWELLAEPCRCSKIDVSAETLVDVTWQPIKHINSQPLSLNEEDSMPPRIDFCRVPGEQRSVVRVLEVQFNEHVTFSRDDLVLEGQDSGIIDLSGAVFGLNDQILYGGIWPATKAWWILPPPGLPDDVYTATIVASNVRLIDDPNVALDGDEDGDCCPGGNHVISFHRLLGDANGDRVVDFADFSILIALWLREETFGGNPLSWTGVDANVDDKINFIDFAAITHNWGKSYE